MALRNIRPTTWKADLHSFIRRGYYIFGINYAFHVFFNEETLFKKSFLIRASPPNALALYFFHSYLARIVFENAKTSCSRWCYR